MKNKWRKTGEKTRIVGALGFTLLLTTLANVRCPPPPAWKQFPPVAWEPGGLAGAEPLQLFGWGGGARNVFEPRNSRNRDLLRNDTG